MTELKKALEREQAPINAALMATVELLPEGSRPVARHVFSAGGKRIRPFLTVTVGKALGCNDPALYTLGAAVETLHAASLIHDDILDNAVLRRGHPAAHTVFGQSTVVLAGDAMLALAVRMVSRLGNTALVDCIAEAVMQTAAGQIKEFTHLRDPELSHEDYLTVITGKTAWMLRASSELGALRACGEAETHSPGTGEKMVRAAANFGLEMGIAFQMVDDAIDFSEDTGKPVGGDLKEGKVTPPLLSYMAALAPDEAAEFKRQFSKDSLSADTMERACREIRENGHTKAARDTAAKHIAAASDNLDLFPPSPEKNILGQMLTYVLERQK
ncbi:polyprenyl synthetase family protein [Desulfovibrio sp. OttesenSCG-928-G15]|nr:polyprenyl synthetase family protein [Desulfovibrio sp. OttesenSCG-928-G15]